jgi:hypothetical protein
MTRKTVIWIAVGALALVAATGFIFGAGRQASAAIGQVRPAGIVTPPLIRPGGMVGPIVRLPGSGAAVSLVAPIGDRGFIAFGLLLALFVGGGIGALITYIVRPSRIEAGAISGATPGGAGPTSGRPSAAEWQQFERWQQFEQWHRQMHAAAIPQEPTSPTQTGMPTDEPTTLEGPAEA